ncbi:hypothetical protein C8R21_10453 [Nitrosospira multiformis]|uniref:Secreted protein n=1 Tax=Nitrosospira multiformis TaxID=1231 RepID=A0A2T5IFA9_9PROT|nr:hypothetical protein C8R21_10453 [Nitrosospira multiformis]
MLSVLILNLLLPFFFSPCARLGWGARSASVEAYSIQMEEPLNKSFQGEVAEESIRCSGGEIKDYRQIRRHWAGMELV